MKLLLTIAFDGGAYCGWQAQNNGPTIQRTINRALFDTYGFECLVTGCSRTDSGVHARRYFLTAEPDYSRSSNNTGETRSIVDIIPLERVPRAINMRLPADIAVIGAAAVPDSFHPRYSAKRKTYEYVFYDSAERNPFYRGRAYHIQPLDGDALRRMKEAAAAMTGRHDFRAFMASGSGIRDTVREVFECGVRREGDLIIFSVTADGFLYNMVRIMAGTALAAARGKIDAYGVKNAIESRDRKQAGDTLPPYGLYLKNVFYL